MLKLEQAARQALEALVEANVISERYQNTEKREAAITALREALAEQAEQEPIGRWNWNEAKFEWLTKFDYHKHHMTPLYAAPVRTKDLTDDEIMKINVDTASIVPTCDRQFHFARAVIAAYKEKQNGR